VWWFGFSKVLVLHDLATLQLLSSTSVHGVGQKTLVEVACTFFYNDPPKWTVSFVKSLSVRVMSPL
jgi:hypothetical protein